MVKPRFFALTDWEPSIGRTDAHVHDKVEFYYNNVIIISIMNKKKRETDPVQKALITIY